MTTTKTTTTDNYTNHYYATTTPSTTIVMTIVIVVVVAKEEEETLSTSNVTLSPTQTVPLCSCTEWSTYCRVFCTLCTVASTSPCTTVKTKLVKKGWPKHCISSQTTTNQLQISFDARNCFLQTADQFIALKVTS